VPEDETFTWRAIKANLFMQDSIFYSLENFYEALVFWTTLCLGIYTIALCLSTLYYARNRTTLIDEIKRDRYWNKRNLLSKKEQQRLFTKFKPLTNQEWC